MRPSVAERVVGRGISLDGALEVFEQIQRHREAIVAQRMHAQLQDAFGALTRRLGEQ